MGDGLDNGSNFVISIPDDTGNLNFGTMTIGAPIIRDFTIFNKGTAALSLSGLQVTGTGFSIAANIGATTVATNSRTTFSLKFNPTTAGTFNGMVSFTTNDADENPYNFAISGTAIAAPTGTPVTRQVSPGGADSGNCQSSACKTIKYTLSQANNGDIITLAAGTYQENLMIDKSVTLQGAASSRPSQIGLANTTIIDGNGATTHQRVMTVANVIVKLSNVTIMNGAPQDSQIAGGGGILNQGNLTLDNVLVTQNKTEGL